MNVVPLLDVCIVSVVGGNNLSGIIQLISLFLLFLPFFFFVPFFILILVLFSSFFLLFLDQRRGVKRFMEVLE